MENCNEQNWFLQPIQDWDRRGDRNPTRVFLKEKVISQASNPQLDLDRDKTFKFSGQPLWDTNFGPTLLRNNFGLDYRRNYLRTWTRRKNGVAQIL